MNIRTLSMDCCSKFISHTEVDVHYVHAHFVLTGLQPSVIAGLMSKMLDRNSSTDSPFARLSNNLDLSVS